MKRVSVKIIYAIYILNISAAFSTNRAITITAIQTSSIVAKTDAYFIFIIL